MATVISASCRTDIPAFYSNWFMQRIKEGYARYHNPMNMTQVCTVSLRPEDVHAIVFWSRNYAPMIRHFRELDELGYNYYCHLTITGLPRELEARTPPLPFVIDTVNRMVNCLGGNRVIWRYDPIVMSEVTTPDWHEFKFMDIARQLEGKVKRCYISFLDFYAKTQRNMAEATRSLGIYQPSNAQMLEVAERLAKMAARYGIQVYSCAEDFLASDSIKQGSCIDKNLLDELFPDKARLMVAKSKRPGCHCYENRDIGAYNTCLHGCRYCYAVEDHNAASSNFMAVNDKHDDLIVGQAKLHEGSIGCKQTVRLL